LSARAVLPMPPIPCKPEIETPLTSIADNNSFSSFSRPVKSAGGGGTSCSRVGAIELSAFDTASASAPEADSLRCQIGTSNKGRGGRRYLPYVFTEQGVAMLSTVLNSERAILVNIGIMRAFVKLRQMLASNTELSRRLDELESKYDKQFRVVFDAIRHLMAAPARGCKEIGFRSRAVKK